jgi:hypothetical protein
MRETSTMLRCAQTEALPLPMAGSCACLRAVLQTHFKRHLRGCQPVSVPFVFAMPTSGDVSPWGQPLLSSLRHCCQPGRAGQSHGSEIRAGSPGRTPRFSISRCRRYSVRLRHADELAEGRLRWVDPAKRIVSHQLHALLAANRPHNSHI